MSKIWDEVRQEGREEGRAEEKIQTTINLWKAGYQDLEMIQKASGLPLTKIKQILEL